MGVGNFGSPPRWRGKGHCTGFTDWRVGITPAWAGKRHMSSSCGRRMRDHPRVGGEKPFLFYGGSSDSGSPPHGRGKGSGPAFRPCPDRITPAWAGKSPLPEGRQCHYQDHPRMGGEKADKERHHNPIRGSPPHGRGKVYLGPQLGAGDWITPAWAGKSSPTHNCQRQRGDHPRMGGEKPVPQP